MRNGTRLILALGLLVLAARPAHGQSLEDLELKKAQKKALELKKKKDWKKDFGFGLLAIVETASGINRDRPSVSTLLYAAPQLKYKQIYRLQLNMGFYGYYLSRDPNPWDLMDWSLQLSSLKLYTEKHTKITLSGNLRYYIPMSIDSRWKENQGALRGAIKLTRSVWKLYFAFEFMAYYHFAKYTTVDAADKVTIPHAGGWAAMVTEDQVANNSQATLVERITASYSPHPRVTLSFIWSWYQLMDYHSNTAAADIAGSSYLQDPRKNNLWDPAFDCIIDVTVNAWKWLYVAVGYSVFANVYQNMGKKVSYNPFDPLYGQFYLDVMAIY